MFGFWPAVFKYTGFVPVVESFRLWIVGKFFPLLGKFSYSAGFVSFCAYTLISSIFLLNFVSVCTPFMINNFAGLDVTLLLGFFVSSSVRVCHLLLCTRSCILGKFGREDTPIALFGILTFTYMVRVCLRSITLGLRLAANMIIGHLLLVFLSALSEKVRGFVFLTILVFFFEVFVRALQAYVFGMLFYVYVTEYLIEATSEKELALRAFTGWSYHLPTVIYRFIVSVVKVLGRVLGAGLWLGLGGLCPKMWHDGFVYSE